MAMQRILIVASAHESVGHILHKILLAFVVLALFNSTSFSVLQLKLLGLVDLAFILYLGYMILPFGSTVI